MNYNLIDLIQSILYYLYEKRLSRKIKKGAMPTHIGLILDGNRRYAKEKGLSDVNDGHREGARRLDDALQWCADLKIKIVTVWVLSPENVNRDRDEVDGLFLVIKDKMEDLASNHVILKNKFRAKAFGNLGVLRRTFGTPSIVARRRPPNSGGHAEHRCRVRRARGDRGSGQEGAPGKEGPIDRGTRSILSRLTTSRITSTYAVSRIPTSSSGPAERSG